VLGRRALLAAALVAGCGDLPRPFQGAPGQEGARLALPPAPRLALPAPDTAMLSQASAEELMSLLAEALQGREVPAVAGPARRGDWRLAVSAELEGGQVVPSFEVRNPQGISQGSVRGAPVPAPAWSEARPETLRATAEQIVPDLANLLDGIEGARRDADPNSVRNRPPRVVFAGVNGAPGDGNEALERQMRNLLPQRGLVIQNAPQGSDFSLAGRVFLTQGAPGLQRVEIQWIVNDAQAREVGRAVQVNEIPRGSLDRLWGDVAIVVAEEASTAVRDIIQRAR
jgi:hypothetical protein